MDVSGTRLRDARVAAGLSLAAMARRTHYSKAMLGHIETGFRTVLTEHVAAYENALGAAIAASHRRVDQHDVRLVRDVVDVLTALGLRHGGTVVVPLCAAHRHAIDGLLRDASSGRVRDQLIAQHARLIARHAWALADAGNHTASRREFATALSHASEPSALRSLTMIDFAGLELRGSRPLDALALVANHGAAHPVIRFTVAGVQAEAHAVLGERLACRRAIERADAAWSDVDIDDVPEEIAPFVSGHAAHVHQVAGKALFLLWRGGLREVRDEAAQRLRSARDAFGPERSNAIRNAEERLRALTR